MSKTVTIGSKKATVTPFASWMVVFVLVPMALVVYYAFTNADGGFTFENLKWIYTYRNTMWLSLRLAFIATVICLCWLILWLTACQEPVRKFNAMQR